MMELKFDKYTKLLENKVSITGFDASMTEHDIMLSRKIYRIYDCGNYRYVWNRT